MVACSAEILLGMAYLYRPTGSSCRSLHAASSLVLLVGHIKAMAILAERLLVTGLAVLPISFRLHGVQSALAVEGSQPCGCLMARRLKIEAFRVAGRADSRCFAVWVQAVAAEAKLICKKVSCSFMFGWATLLWHVVQLMFFSACLSCLIMRQVME